LSQRTAELDDLTRRQREARIRDPQTAAGLDPLIAAKQQDLYDLRSLADRVRAATSSRDAAAAEGDRAVVEIAHWRSVAESSGTIPVGVRSSVSTRHLPLRVAVTAVAGVVAGACAIALLREHRRRSTPRSRRRYAGATPSSVANT